MLMSVLATAKGQDEGVELDKIDFNDTSLIESDILWSTISDYITQEQNKDSDKKSQIYNMILATDNVLSRCMSYPMYKSVYQFLISGFSELGANLVVDYMARMPYLEFINADDEQMAEIMHVASQYERVKIGKKAPDIQSVTIDNAEFALSNIEKKYTLVLFWSYSCPHCRDLIDELADIKADYQDLAIVTVNVAGEKKKVKKMLKQTHFDKNYNIYDGKGWNSPIVEDYAVDMTPSMFLLDENKILIAKPLDIEELIKIIEL